MRKLIGLLLLKNIVWSSDSYNSCNIQHFVEQCNRNNQLDISCIVENFGQFAVDCRDTMSKLGRAEDVKYLPEMIENLLKGLLPEDSVGVKPAVWNDLVDGEFKAPVTADPEESQDTADWVLYDNPDFKGPSWIRLRMQAIIDEEASKNGDEVTEAEIYGDDESKEVEIYDTATDGIYNEKLEEVESENGKHHKHDKEHKKDKHGKKHKKDKHGKENKHKHENENHAWNCKGYKLARRHHFCPMLLPLALLLVGGICTCCYVRNRRNRMRQERHEYVQVSRASGDEGISTPLYVYDEGTAVFA